MMFSKKKKYADFVFLTVGTVYFKPLTNMVVQKAKMNSTIYGDVINNSVFFNIVENDLLQLSSKLKKVLTVDDGNKVRDKTKEILLRHGLLDETPTKKPAWDSESKDWFRKAQEKGLKKIREAAKTGAE